MRIILDLKLGYPASVRNYFHFLIDTVCPLYGWLREKGLLKGNHVIYLFHEEPGAFWARGEILKEIFPGVRFVPGQPWHRVQPLRRFSLASGVWWRHKPREVWRKVACAFGSYVIKQLRIDTESRKKFILVERRRDVCAEGEGWAGVHRRSISNHEEVAERLERFAETVGLEFHNIRCETLSFREQARLFYNSEVVVAQHGAAFANMLWMRPEAAIVHCHSIPSCFLSRVSFLCGVDQYLEFITPNAKEPIDRVELGPYARSTIREYQDGNIHVDTQKLISILEPLFCPIS